jgi:capsular polysaccharide export protein
MATEVLAADKAGQAVSANWRAPVPGNPAFACLSNARRVLLLQGPVGPFFDRITDWLHSFGCRVDRVVLHGGDEADCQRLHPICFSEPQSSWPAFLGTLLREQRPDCIVLFGQNRYYHKVALERARAIDLPVVVLEEGYFRPGYVTMELWGVNGYSTTLDRFTWAPEESEDGEPAVLAPQLTGMHFQKMAWHASRHYLAMQTAKQRFPHYIHHRCDDLGFYARYWTRSWARKAMHRAPDRRLQRWLFDSGTPYYFVPLQLEGDSQIVHHSPFQDNSDFILRVMPSFARHASAEALLVFRQHPHARGGAGNNELIRTLAKSLKISDRVFHMTEGDTPDLAERSMGTIVINSTVGLQALERHVPVIALGDALYKQPEFTFMGDIDAFWHERRKPDLDATRAFLAQVKHLTQAPASIYALRDQALGWAPGATLPHDKQLSF